ncbi:MAG: Mur ligase family protein, partial [Pseudomonadota bacterium]
MIPVRGYQGRRVAVLGLGRSGRATVAALLDGGAEPIVWDDGQGARGWAEAEGLTLADPTRPGTMEGISALIVSPGIPHLYPAPHPAIAAAQAAGAVIDNDVGLFFRSFATDAWDGFDSPPRVVCITGSNGKSTTTALVHHILASAGLPTQMGGNIGRGVLDLDPGHDGEVVVLELSSYQIELARALAPDLAVFLNL